MDVTSISGIVSTVGFPVAIACFLLWIFSKRTEKVEAKLAANEEFIKKELLAMIKDAAVAKADLTVALNAFVVQSKSMPCLASDIIRDASRKALAEAVREPVNA